MSGFVKLAVGFLAGALVALLALGVLGARSDLADRPAGVQAIQIDDDGPEPGTREKRSGDDREGRRPDDRGEDADGHPDDDDDDDAEPVEPAEPLDADGHLDDDARDDDGPDENDGPGSGDDSIDD